MCKKSLWKLAAEIAVMTATPVVQRALSVATYEELKSGEASASRRKVKQDVRKKALKGWISNGGEAFSLGSSAAIVRVSDNERTLPSTGPVSYPLNH